MSDTSEQVDEDQAKQDLKQSQSKASSDPKGLATSLVQAFARQLETLKTGLKTDEIILLGFGSLSECRHLQKIDLKVQDADIIAVSVTWAEGDVEQRVFTAQSFQPILTKEVEQQSALSEEARSLVQQVLGHLTAHGVLYTQMLARDAENAMDAKGFLESEHARAIEVVRTANISAAGMDADEIRNKALAVVDQTFDSILIDAPTEKRVIN